MKPLISCFYFHWYYGSLKYIFIEYDFFFKVIINEKSIILTKQQLTLNSKLFQIYIILLLLTENNNDIMYITTLKSNKKIYGIKTIWYYKDYANVYELDNKPLFTKINLNNNQLNAEEPKKHNSLNEINKFMIFSDNIYNSNNLNKIPEIIYNYYQQKSKKLFDYFEKYIAHEKKIEMLSVILHNYGIDVYNAVNKFL